MKNFILLISITFSVFTYAEKNKSSHEAHREHGAHVHGGGKLALAFDGEKGKVEFKCAAESILGFEHKVKNQKDKDTVNQMISKFKNEVDQMIKFDTGLGCKFITESVGQVPEEGEDAGSGEHSDWAATYNVMCSKSPEGTKVVFNFAQFRRLKDVDITILVNNVQKSSEYKSKELSVEIR